MKKLLAIVLAVAMVISTSGITIASIACTRNAQKRAAMCQLCQKSKSGRSTQKKSCCQQSAKFFAIKTNFEKPTMASASPLTVVALLQVVTTPLVTIERPTEFASYSLAPNDSGQKCALISRFRI